MTGVERIILASASPRRAELLREAGIEFETVAANVDEAVRPGEDPDTYVRRLAAAKVEAIVGRAEGRPVLAADTAVVVEGMILGKPIDRHDARRMLRLLSGRAHDVVTGVAVATPAGITAASESTCVEFRALTDAEIDAYVETGEPDGKAGGYAIQGQAGQFVSRISGSHSNVVGLPMDLVRALLGGAVRRLAVDD